MVYKIAVGIVVVLLGIQLVPYGKEQSNPPVSGEPAWDRPVTRELFFRACADCHSNETEWPWYSRYAPVSWLVAHDVYEGREHLNVSMWGLRAYEDADDAAETVREGEMPPWFYVIPHPEAELSGQQKADLIRGLRRTFSAVEE